MEIRHLLNWMHACAPSWQFARPASKARLNSHISIFILYGSQRPIWGYLSTGHTMLHKISERHSNFKTNYRYHYNLCVQMLLFA
jgi:hypothetical protein